MDPRFEQARDFFLQGVAHYEAGRFVEAERVFAAALSLVPGRVSVLTNLGATRLKLGRAEEAIALLDEALAQEADNAEALAHKGTALAELGSYGQALQALDRSLELNPAQGAAWMHRGTVLRDLDRVADAIASFEKSLAHGGDPQLNAYYLASLRGDGAPPAPPRHYVQGLFDGYAGQFNRHLVDELRYDAPQVLTQRLASGGKRFERALDLGCGTGLCGPLLKPMCREIDGVDLSAVMLDQAQALHAYQTLEQADIVDYLRATPRRYDLVVAADVLVYLGDLEPVFAGVERVLQPKGVFCCTVELADEGEFVLRSTLRYAHSEAYQRSLAQAHALAITHVEHRAIREDQRVPIPGLFMWMERR